MSISPDSAVSWCTITSGSACATARPTASGSSASATTGRAPSPRSTSSPITTPATSAWRSRPCTPGCRYLPVLPGPAQRSSVQRRLCRAATSSTATAARGSGARGSAVAGGYGGQQRSWPTVNKRPQPPRGPNSYSNPRSATTHGGGSEGSAPRANTAARGEADRKPASSTNQLVDLVGAYSKRQDLSDDLQRALLRLKSAQAESQTKARQRVSVQSAVKPRAWRLVERFTDEDISKIIRTYQNGLTIKQVAERFTIGTSSVKKLIRERKARRRTGLRPAE